MADAFSDFYARHAGKVSDKWERYLSVYEGLLAPWRFAPLSLLEIGVQNGGSLEIYAAYFPNATQLVGCDINPDCAALEYADPRIRVVVGDANSDPVHRDITGQSPDFDLIIDDGSHRSGDIVCSFARYFQHLKVGGLYIVEDLSCSYWQEYEGGLYSELSSMAFLHALSDIVNHEHWGVPYLRRERLALFSERYGCEFSEGELAKIHSLEFYNSLCVIRKLPLQENVLGVRVVAGSEERVFPGILQEQGGEMPQMPQAENPLARRSIGCDPEIAALRAALKHQQRCLDERQLFVDSLLASRSWRCTAPLRRMVTLARRLRFGLRG